MFLFFFFLLFPILPLILTNRESIWKQGFNWHSCLYKHDRYDISGEGVILIRTDLFFLRIWKQLLKSKDFIIILNKWLFSLEGFVFLCNELLPKIRVLYTDMSFPGILINSTADDIHQYDKRLRSSGYSINLSGLFVHNVQIGLESKDFQFFAHNNHMLV